MKDIRIKTVSRIRHSKASLHVWCDSYIRHLCNLFCIFMETIKSRYETDTPWEDDAIFELFCQFIYDNSSKTVDHIHNIDY